MLLKVESSDAFGNEDRYVTVQSEGGQTVLMTARERLRCGDAKDVGECLLPVLVLERAGEKARVLLPEIPLIGQPTCWVSSDQLSQFSQHSQHT